MDLKALCLRIVPLKSLHLHEGCEAQRVARLVERLQEDGILRNPPIVVQVGSEYVVLDGATRVEALRVLGIRDALVQVVGDESDGLGLETWNHLIMGMEPCMLKDGLEAIEGIELHPTTAASARRLLDKKEILCYIILASGDLYAVRVGGDLEDKTRLLEKVVDVYQGRAEIFRLAGFDLETFLRREEGFSAVVVFPRYRPSEVIHLATNGARLPAGITRFLVPGRALYLNISLGLLAAEMPLEEKNRELERIISEKLKQRRVRFYQEPIYVFDD